MYQTFLAMTDNTEKPEDQHDIERQQQNLFRELSREQIEAEQALESEQERLAAGKPQDESDD